MARELILVSNVQKELADERCALAAFEKIGTTGRGTYYVLKVGTRHKPDKPDARRDGRETRQEPAKPDTTDRALRGAERSLEERTRRPHRKGASKGPNGPSQPAPGKTQRRTDPAASRQEPAKPAMGASSHVPRRAKRPEPYPKWVTKGSIGSSLRGPREWDKNGTNGT